MQRVAMKAVLVSAGKVLILRKASIAENATAAHGRYNLPGGRIEAGESWEVALKREVLEETGIRIKIDYPLYVGRWFPTIKGVDYCTIALFSVCKPSTDKVVLSSEHDDYRWINPKDRRQFDIMDPEEEVIDLFAKWQAR